MFWKYAANLRENTHAECDFNKIALQLYWNHTSALVFSCKFAVYFQSTSGWLILIIFFGTMEGVWKLRSHFSYKSNSKERNLQHPGKSEEIWIQSKSIEKFIQQHDKSNRFSILFFQIKSHLWKIISQTGKSMGISIFTF